MGLLGGVWVPDGLAGIKRLFLQRKKCTGSISKDWVISAADLNAYLEKRGITEAQMDEARKRTQTLIESYSLREARMTCGLTQEKLADAIGVSQNRVSRIKGGDTDAMSLGAVRR